MKKKLFIKLSAAVLSLLMLSGVLLTGCGSKENVQENASSSASSVKAEESAAPVKEEGVKGDFELQIFVGGYGDKIWKDAMDGFKKENPDVNLIVNMGPKVNDQMNTRWISDNPPDFVFIEGPNIPKEQLIKDGKFMDLTSWYDTAKNKGSDTLIKDKLLPNMLVKEADGKTYMAPVLFNCWGMWYDEKLFNDNGVTPPANFEDVLGMSEQFKAKNIAGMDYAGVYAGYLVAGGILPALASEGGEELLKQFGSDLNPDIFKGEAFKKVMTKLKSFVDKGYMMKGTVALNHTQSQMEWLNRKAALIPNGLWLETEMKKDIPADFKMKFIPSVFQDKGQKMSVIPYGISVAIAANAKNPDAAKAFLEYLYRDETLKSFVEASGSPSAAKLDISNANVSDVTKDIMKKISSPDVQFVPCASFCPGAAGKELEDVVSAIVLGKITVDEACDRMYKAALSEKNK